MGWVWVGCGLGVGWVWVGCGLSSVVVRRGARTVGEGKRMALVVVLVMAAGLMVLVVVRGS